MVIGNTNSIRDSTVPCRGNSNSDSNDSLKVNFKVYSNSNSNSKLVIQIISV